VGDMTKAFNFTKPDTFVPSLLRCPRPLQQFLQSSQSAQLTWSAPRPTCFPPLKLYRRRKRERRLDRVAHAREGPGASESKYLYMGKLWDHKIRLTTRLVDTLFLVRHIGPEVLKVNQKFAIFELCGYQPCMCSCTDAEIRTPNRPRWRSYRKEDQAIEVRFRSGETKQARG
jgi:hypothetical protein